jgi:hypothetical protein
MTPTQNSRYTLVHVQGRENAIVNRLNKTKVEKEVDHESERQERLRVEGRKKKAEAQERVSLLRMVLPNTFSISSYLFSDQNLFAALPLHTQARAKFELK